MSDRHVATLDMHENIELRLFKPLGQCASYLVQAAKQNSGIRRSQQTRMHNKLLVTTNLAMISGGTQYR